MGQLGYRIFDADNHYYEAVDALTRHLDPKLRRPVAEWAEVRGKPRLLIGGALNDFIPNPTFDTSRPESDENPRAFVLRKTLAIRYDLPGDPLTRTVSKPVRRTREWVMR